MSDVKTVKDAWDHYNGVWPDDNGKFIFYTGCVFSGFRCLSQSLYADSRWQEVCTKEEFEAYGEDLKKMPGDGLFCPPNWIGDGQVKMNYSGHLFDDQHSDGFLSEILGKSADEVCKAMQKQLDKIKQNETSKWNGEGLPTVGAVVAYNRFHGLVPTKDWLDGEELEVIAHRDAECGGVAVVWNKKRLVACSLAEECLKPLKSDADQFVEKVKESFEYIAGESRHALIERLARFIYESEIKGH